MFSGFDLSSFPFGGIIIVIAALVYWIPAFFLVYHLLRFGIGTRPKLIALIFLIGSVILFSILVVSFIQIDLVDLLQQFFQSLQFSF